MAPERPMVVFYYVLYNANYWTWVIPMANKNVQKVVDNNLADDPYVA
ncbi:hypothetical protein SAMN05660226_00776 [Parapedobacter luteus]|uniref:Uncharacterized protein n=1 Tax=Parapedobacter luteus TaxID=623280 RepID=A0A1T5AHX9_9SPHI|nr:hypothetical protein SAMN05660226_00776 [Parapedobacter luteus]